MRQTNSDTFFSRSKPYVNCYLLLLSRLRPHRQKPSRLPCPWGSPGKNTGVGCRFLLQCVKWKVKGNLLSRVQLFATPWTAAYQAPLSMGFSRQEYWSGVPLPSPNCYLSVNKIIWWIHSNQNQTGSQVSGAK